MFDKQKNPKTPEKSGSEKIVQHPVSQIELSRLPKLTAQGVSEYGK